MPGLYTEPDVARAPTNDPGLRRSTRSRTTSGQTGALSYAYQFHCPNDQNLIAVLGRAPGTGKPTRSRRARTATASRTSAPCIRCNLQIEGSGVVARRRRRSTRAASSPATAAPIGVRRRTSASAPTAPTASCSATSRCATPSEHDIYVLETDGYLLDRFKAFYAGEYGVLTFVEDHGVMQNCEAAGQRRLGPVPGRRRRDRRAATATASTRVPLQPGDPQLRLAPQRARLLGHRRQRRRASTTTTSTTTRSGFTTDVFTAPGHPGFPQDSDLVENNNFYSNNFNPYAPGSDVEPSRARCRSAPGLWIAGGNDNIVRNNHFYDNWRRGTMLFAVPDAGRLRAAGDDHAAAAATRRDTDRRPRTATSSTAT